MLSPRHSYELSLKRIGRYLKFKDSRGLIFSPSYNLKIDYYPCINFTGMYGNEEITDLAFVKSRTVSVITVADFLVLWQLKL